MRYGLRTLLILLAIGPALTAVVFWRVQEFWAFRDVARINARMTAANNLGLPDDYGGSLLYSVPALLLTLIITASVLFVLRRRHVRRTVFADRKLTGHDRTIVHVTIRDALSVTVVVVMALLWFIDHRNGQHARRKLLDREADLMSRLGGEIWASERWRDEAEKLKERLEVAEAANESGERPQ